MKTLEKYICDVLITQSSHSINHWNQRTLANENANRCRRAKGRSDRAALWEHWNSALPQLLPSSELLIQATACKSLNVTVRGAAHHHECHCCNQTSPKVKTQFASKNSTTKPQQPEISASPQGQLQKVLQIWFINNIVPHLFLFPNYHFPTKYLKVLLANNPEKPANPEVSGRIDTSKIWSSTRWTT